MQLKKTISIGLCAALVAAIFVSLIGNLYMMTATLSYSFLLIGFLIRKAHFKPHAFLMTSGIMIDLGIVLTLELKRNAIATAADFSLTPFQQMHVFSSSLTTLLYFPVLYFGFKILAAKKLNQNILPKIRMLHLNLGKTALIFRTIGFILMFSLLDKI